MLCTDVVCCGVTVGSTCLLFGAVRVLCSLGKKFLGEFSNSSSTMGLTGVVFFVGMGAFLSSAWTLTILLFPGDSAICTCEKM